MVGRAIAILITKNAFFSKPEHSMEPDGWLVAFQRSAADFVQSLGSEPEPKGCMTEHAPRTFGRVGRGIEAPVRNTAVGNAAKMHKAARLAIRTELVTARAEAETARQQVRLYTSTLVPQAGAAYEASHAAYRVGRVDFMAVLDAQMALGKDNWSMTGGAEVYLPRISRTILSAVRLRRRADGLTTIR